MKRVLRPYTRKDQADGIFLKGTADGVIARDGAPEVRKGGRQIETYLYRRGS